MIRKNVAAAAAAVGLAAAAPASAATYADGIALEAGRGNDDTNLLRISVQSDWSVDWVTARGWRLGGYWELALGGWDNDTSIGDFALTPVFRFARQTGELKPYVEAAIGFHVLSHHISADRNFATNFQFGDHLGAGMRFGESGRYDLGVRVQHISNGGIAQPNPGINFVIVRFQYQMRP